MITHKITEEKVYKPNAVTCDVCGHSWFWHSSEAEEFEYIRREGGFSSVFGDSVRVSCDICQNCLKKLIGKYIEYPKES